ncbi:hypothetical protein ACFT1B_37110, partial [Streptomyces griseoincarnatus]
MKHPQLNERPLRDAQGAFVLLRCAHTLLLWRKNGNLVRTSHRITGISVACIDAPSVRRGSTVQK